jgi:hypothetical protein
MCKPNPPKMGANAFVMVEGADGKPIADAEVSVTFLMAAMPAMKMPETRNSVTLKHPKDGTDSGTGNVALAGKWDGAVSVKRAGKEIATKKLSVSAR